MTPILMLGAGRMGGAMIDGWMAAGAFRPSDIMVRDPQPGALPKSVVLNPPDEELRKARTVVMAVKPQIWREAAAPIVPHLAPDAIVVSIAAGPKAADIAQVYGGRRTARVMPTTAVAIGQGAASLYSTDADALAVARALFEPIATVAELADEELIHAAIAVSGSAPAYLYAFIEALEQAGARQGLDEDAAKGLARATIAGAAALLARSGADPAELRRQVTSPGGTTQAALEVLMPELPGLMDRALTACANRSRELGA